MMIASILGSNTGKLALGPGFFATTTPRSPLFACTRLAIL